jgi:hypothetical protein
VVNVIDVYVINVFIKCICKRVRFYALIVNMIFNVPLNAFELSIFFYFIIIKMMNNKNNFREYKPDKWFGNILHHKFFIGYKLNNDLYIKVNDKFV